MSGVCPPCREDRHEGHLSHYTVEVVRKGLVMRTRRVLCECVCLRPEGWRGEPQPVPKWGSKP